MTRSGSNMTRNGSHMTRSGSNMTRNGSHMTRSVVKPFPSQISNIKKSNKTYKHSYTVQLPA